MTDLGLEGLEGLDFGLGGVEIGDEFVHDLRSFLVIIWGSYKVEDR